MAKATTTRRPRCEGCGRQAKADISPRPDGWQCMACRWLAEDMAEHEAHQGEQAPPIAQAVPEGWSSVG
jgi:tRNA(Ile2) C34 agmatinyltransferase TiaS